MPAPYYGTLDAACPVNWDYPGNRGLVGWWAGWPLSGWCRGLKLRDAVAHSGKAGSGHATLTGGATWAASPAGGSSVSCTRAPAYAVTDNNIPLTGLSKVTLVSFGFVRSFQTSSFPFISNCTETAEVNTGSAYIGLRFGVDATNATSSNSCAVIKTTAGVDSSVGGISYAANSQFWIAGVYNSGLWSLYDNGLFSNSASTSGTLNTTLPLYIGASPNWAPSGGFRAIDGLIHGTMLFNTALSARGIAALYQQSRLGNPDSLRWLRGWVRVGGSLGSVTTTGTGISLGYGFPPAAGAATGSGSGVTIGEGVAPATGLDTLSAVAVALGVGAAPSSGAATESGSGASEGIGLSPATGAETASGVGTGSGIGIAPATGLATASGSGQSEGLGTAPASGAATEQASGSAIGQGTAPAAGAETALGTGSAEGVGTAPSSGAATEQASGSAIGLGISPAAGGTGASAVGVSLGDGYGIAVGTAIYSGSGVASGYGIAPVSGEAISSGLGQGVSLGVGIVTGEGAVTAAAGGVSLGVSAGDTVVAIQVAGSGASAGFGYATARAATLYSGSGVSLGYGFATGDYTPPAPSPVPELIYIVGHDSLTDELRGQDLATEYLIGHDERTVNIVA